MPTDRTSDDWVRIAMFSLLGVLLVATMILTAPGEYKIAIQAGWPVAGAWAYPVVVDAYVSLASLTKSTSDGVIAFLVKAVIQVTTHLAAVDMIPVNWVFITIVALAPVIIGGRSHHMAFAAIAKMKSKETPPPAEPNGPPPAPQPPVPTPFRPAEPVISSPARTTVERGSVWNHHAEGECKASVETHRKIKTAAQAPRATTQDIVADIAGVTLRTAQRCLTERRDIVNA